MITIRQATTNDAKVVAKLHSESWQQSYQGHLDQNYLTQTVPQERQTFWQQRFNNPTNNQHILIAETNNTIIGFACVYFDKYPNRGSYLDNLHVNQNQQSKGIGRLLLKEVAKLCDQKAKSKSLCLLVTQFNQGAQHFYQRYGALNQEPSIWNAPEGSEVPTYWFIWDSLEAIEKG